MNTGKVMLSILAAATAGAAIGILFAPDKGYRTRKKFLRKGSDFKDSLKDKINDFVEEVSDQYENAKGYAGDLMEGGKSKISSSKADGKQHTNSFS